MSTYLPGFQRYQLTDYAAAPLASRKVYDDFCITNGTHQVPAWLASMGHHPALARACWEHTRACLHMGRLPLLLKEMVMYGVAREHGAVYCEAAHAAELLQLDDRLGLDDLPRLLEPGNPLGLPAASEAALAFAVQVARDPRAVTDSQFEQLRISGFQPEEIHELLAVVHLAVMLSGYTTSLRLPPEPRRAAVSAARPAAAARPAGAALLRVT